MEYSKWNTYKTRSCQFFFGEANVRQPFTDGDVSLLSRLCGLPSQDHTTRLFLIWIEMVAIRELGWGGEGNQTSVLLCLSQVEKYQALWTGCIGGLRQDESNCYKKRKLMPPSLTHGFTGMPTIIPSLQIVLPNANHSSWLEGIRAKWLKH